MTNTKNIAELHDDVIDSLRKIKWSCRPKRGKLKELGIELGFKPSTASSVFRNRI